MTFRNDKNLQALSRARWCDGFGMTPEEHGHELYDWLTDEGLLEHTMENIGLTLLQAIGTAPVRVISDKLGRLYHGLESDLFDAFCQLVIISEGCPECGGPLAYVETEGHELKDGDYWTPNSYEIDNYVYHCTECGKIIKSKTEL